MLAHPGLEPLNPPSEQFRAGEPRVAHPSGYVIAGRILAPGSQLLAQEYIPNLGLGQRRLQCLAPKLWVEATVGCGADIRHRGDPVPLEEGQEALDRVVRMSDGMDHTAFRDLARTRNYLA